MISLTIDPLQELVNELILTNRVRANGFMLFIDDGSTDDMVGIIQQNQSGCVRARRLSANVGHQHTLIAGLNHAATQMKIYLETEQRPHYHVEQYIGHEKSQQRSSLNCWWKCN